MPSSRRRCVSSRTPPARSAASSRRSTRRRGCARASSRWPGSKRTTRPARPPSPRVGGRGADAPVVVRRRSSALPGWLAAAAALVLASGLGLWALQLRTSLDDMNARVERAEAEVVRIQRTLGEAQEQTRVLQAQQLGALRARHAARRSRRQAAGAGVDGAGVHEPPQRPGVRGQPAAGAAGRQGLPAVGGPAGRGRRSAPACWRPTRAATPRCSSRCRPTCRRAAVARGDRRARRRRAGSDGRQGARRRRAAWRPPARSRSSDRLRTIHPPGAPRRRAS